MDELELERRSEKQIVEVRAPMLSSAGNNTQTPYEYNNGCGLRDWGVKINNKLQKQGNLYKVLDLGSRD
ncbi:interferon gamma receptor 1 [Sesbania bispinosa]|nr:interferon gamma receptor 1 [Sesbania bispinosa]